MTAPSPFCKDEPKLQYAWDATSLRALMMCPRYYEYTIIKGYRGSTIDLEFGIIVHQGVEECTHKRLDGASKDDATLAAIKHVMEHSGEYNTEDEWVPWGGSYQEQWRCLGTEKYKNEKGNAAKCPWAFKGKWYIPPAPSTCGECGSGTETVTNWIPDNPAKDRFAALRLVAWYCFEQPDDFNKGLVSYKFANGTHAVELSFKLPLPFKAPTGDNYVLCGHFDKLATFDNDMFVVDLKTTKLTLSKAFWSRYSPDIQMDTYDFAGSVLFSHLNMRGLIIEGAQTMVGGARYGIQIYYRTESQREEYLRELKMWLKLAEEYAKNDYWPMNPASCWHCDFNGVCSKDPDQRQRVLDADFKVKHWNTLEER